MWKSEWDFPLPHENRRAGSDTRGRENWNLQHIYIYICFILPLPLSLSHTHAHMCRECNLLIVVVRNDFVVLLVSNRSLYFLMKFPDDSPTQTLTEPPTLLALALKTQFVTHF